MVQSQLAFMTPIFTFLLIFILPPAIILSHSLKPKHWLQYFSPHAYFHEKLYYITVLYIKMDRYKHVALPQHSIIMDTCTPICKN